MIISHKYRYIFVKTRKIAGTSVEMYLNKFRRGDDIFTPISSNHEKHYPQNYTGTFNLISELNNTQFKYARTSISDFVYKKKFWNHIPGLLIKSRIDPKTWDEYYKFTIERNPWDKIISHYKWKTRKNQNTRDFNVYLNKGDFPKDFDRYTDLKGNIIVDKIIRYENLDIELNEVFNEFRIPFSGKLNIYAKSGLREKKSYQDYYNDESKKIVANLYKEEISKFNYKF